MGISDMRFCDGSFPRPLAGASSSGARPCPGPAVSAALSKMRSGSLWLGRPGRPPWLDDNGAGVERLSRAR